MPFSFLSTQFISGGCVQDFSSTIVQLSNNYLVLIMKEIKQNKTESINYASHCVSFDKFKERKKQQ